MAKRLAVVVVVILVGMLLLPALGMAMAMAPCPACALPDTVPMGAGCLAVLGTAIVVVMWATRRAFAPIIDRQPTGPPGARLFRPPRST